MGTSVRVITSFPVDLTGANISGVTQQGAYEVTIEPVEVRTQEDAEYQVLEKLLGVAEWELLRRPPGEAEPRDVAATDRGEISSGGAGPTGTGVPPAPGGAGDADAPPLPPPNPPTTTEGPTGSGDVGPEGR